MKLENRRELEAVLDRWATKSPTGCWVVYDGQFGSTGKGVLSSLVGELVGPQFDLFTTNQGPNSGHCFYYRSEGFKHVLKQLPVSAVVKGMAGLPSTAYLNAGAIVNPVVLENEARLHLTHHASAIYVDPAAARIVDEDQTMDEATRKAIGSTGQGVGPALIRKISRVRQDAVMSSFDRDNWSGIAGGKIVVGRPVTHKKKVLVEVAQGFDLGINGSFYPHVTARECSPMQALADLRMPLSSYVSSIACVRTFPIRVASPPGGTSGPGWPGQLEISWKDLGVPPEKTTVTDMVRRVFTWHDHQFRNMVQQTHPSAIFVNFLNYLPDGAAGEFIETNIIGPYKQETGRMPEFVLGGYGPKSSDVRVEYVHH